MAKSKLTVTGKTKLVDLKVCAEINTKNLTLNELDQIQKVLGTKLMHAITELPFVHLSLIDVKVK